MNLQVGQLKKFLNETYVVISFDTEWASVLRLDTTRPLLDYKVEHVESDSLVADAEEWLAPPEKTG